MHQEWHGKVNPIQVEKYLKGMDYPASKNDILQRAQQNHAPDNVKQSLEKMPDRKFNRPTDVVKALKKAA